MTTPPYDFQEISRRRARGETWDSIGASYDRTGDAVRKWFNHPSRQTPPGTNSSPEHSVTRTLTRDQVSRITSLEDLIEFFEVDTELWEVRDYRVNKWEQHSVKKGFVELYQVRANLIPRIEHRVEAARIAIEEMLADAAAHAPAYEPIERPSQLSSDGDPVLFEMAIMDPHIGMLAWGDEVGGENQDHALAVTDYLMAVNHLLPLARLYPTEKILYVVGNDLLHVDTSGEGGKGGATKRGTPQDVDTRRAKLFTSVRRMIVEALDRARGIAPVDVLVVPGNHDEDEMYRLGEALSAWYRLDPEVNVIFGPNRRKFFGWGANAWMFTHGEEYNRKRDSLPLIFATECPADIWTASEGGCREVHTGHNHRLLAGGYHPTSEASESRGIRTRSLPGLTATDAWHHESGYHHYRAATAIAYRKSGGVAGLHEFNPNRRGP